VLLYHLTREGCSAVAPLRNQSPHPNTARINPNSAVPYTGKGSETAKDDGTLRDQIQPPSTPLAHSAAGLWDGQQVEWMSAPTFSFSLNAP
jgi:hypothetical protein